MKKLIEVLQGFVEAGPLVLNGVTRRHSEDYYGSSYYSYGNVYGEGSDDDRRAVAS